MERIVGESGIFIFADIYPDLAAWSAVEEALHAEAAQEIEQGLIELLDCT